MGVSFSFPVAHFMNVPRFLLRCAPLLGLLAAARLPAADQPQWGQAWTRNMVSAERARADSFGLETGRNVKWSVPLGTHAHTTPILAASAGAREAVGPKIFHSTWSSPALGQVGGRDAIIFCGGDGIVRAFEPLAKAPPAGEVAKL